MSITISGTTLVGISIGMVTVIGIMIALVVGSSAIFAKPDVAKIKELLHQYTNEEREALGRATLVISPELEIMAQRHSEDMASFGYFGHWDSEGKGVTDRFNDAGINCIGSENLAAPTNANSENEIALAAVQGWMSSDQGHRENLLNGQWQSQGFGVAFNAAGDTAYITQNFCN